MMETPVGPIRLTGGLVAHNEGANVEGALRSLLDQSLPVGVSWETIWVVASGCTDDTVRVVERVAQSDSRVRLIVEAARGGKAKAVQQIFQRARGDGLVLLNGDARAEPGAIRALLAAAPWGRAPWAVMARPVVPPERNGSWTGAIRVMWELHHQFHRLLQKEGGGTHLSDELLLMSLPSHPSLPEGIINDGSYVGGWLAQNGGLRRYAEDARVSIETPTTLSDHLHQRRRIQVGNLQVASLLGAPVSTLSRYALRHPGTAFALVRTTISSTPGGGRNLLRLVAAELLAKVLSLWDRLPPRRDHVRWHQIARRSLETESKAEPTPEVRGGPGQPSDQPSFPTPLAERRVASLLEVAARFQTGVTLEELIALLPDGSPLTPLELVRWLADRQGLARLEGGRAFSPGLSAPVTTERRDRGSLYRDAATELVDRHLRPVLSWIRCIGLSGSTAYGEPGQDDDIDFFVVTKSGALWCFLAYSYLAVRLRFIPSSKGTRPRPCFNYVLSDDWAAREFVDDRGFLVAREALSVRSLRGDPYYRGLLASAAWMREEIPRLYAERTVDRASTTPIPAGWPIRLANLFLYPVVATYLQLAGLRRNAMARRAGRSEAIFRTQTQWGRLTFQSERFDRLRDHFRLTASVRSTRFARPPSGARSATD